MSNKKKKLRKFVPLHTDEEMYSVRFSHNALVALEEESGLGVVRFAEKLAAGDVSIRDIRIMLWAGLIEKHPEVSLHDTGKIMDEVGLQVATKVCTEAFFGAFPQANQKKADSEKTVKANDDDEEEGEEGNEES